MNKIFQAPLKKLIPVALSAIGAAAALSFANPAAALPVGWTCVGTCGTTTGADGVVQVPAIPAGATGFDWIATTGAPAASAGINGASLGLGSETNGSLLSSNVFSATVGDSLKFAFNYITSDGAGFADYAWARLVDTTANSIIGYLVTARTVTSGSIIPGLGMPAIMATLAPASVPIIPGGPAWSSLGGNSGQCFNTGCGYTGWVESDYTIAATGNYQLQFGVVNWSDTLYNSGLAISGATIGGAPITTVPEPGSIALIGAAALLGLAARRRRSA